MKQKVWLIQLINYELIKVYSIGTDYDGIFNSYEYRINQLELIKYPERKDLEERNHKILDEYNSYMKKNNYKLAIPPSRLWIETRWQEFPTDEEYLFHASGSIIMTEKCANIFKRFNLGKNLLTPVQIFELETKKLWKNELFYALQICDERQYMLPKQNSSGLNYIPYPLYKKALGLYSSYDILQDNSIKLSSDVLQCDIDLWEDPLLGHNIFFISENLYSTLKKENLIDRFSPALCEIIL